MISNKNKIVVFVLMAAAFIGSLSQNLLTSALPSILADFGISAAIGQWLTTSYILVMGIITALTAFLFYKFETKLLVQVSLAVSCPSVHRTSHCCLQDGSFRLAVRDH